MDDVTRRQELRAKFGDHFGDDPEWGMVGETLTLYAAEAVWALHVHTELPWRNRLGRIKSVDREHGEITLKFVPEFFHVEELPDGRMQQYRCRDDMKGNVTREQMGEPVRYPGAPKEPVPSKERN